MVWARIDDAILDNEKIVRAGVFGFALHIAAITWCARNLTDGRIPAARVSALLMLDRVNVDEANPLALIDGARSMGGSEGLDPITVAEHLVDCGLWHHIPGGYELNDFLDYNPSKAEVEKKRTKENKRKAEKAACEPAAGTVRALPRQRVGTSAQRCPHPDPDPDPDPDPEPREDLLFQPTMLAPQDAAPSEVTPVRNRGARLPSGWTPTAETQAWAREHGVSEPCGKLLDEFRDYWAGVPGAKGVKLDWEATYRNHVRRAADRAPTRRFARAGTRQPLGDWKPNGTGTEGDF